jgi:hypothetical protein
LFLLLATTNYPYETNKTIRDASVYSVKIREKQPSRLIHPGPRQPAGSISPDAFIEAIRGRTAAAS